MFACDRAKYLLNNFNKIELHFFEIIIGRYRHSRLLLSTSFVNSELSREQSLLTELSEGGSQRMSNLL